MLVDAADDDERLLQLIGAEALATIVTTHRHGDHWQALPMLAARTGAALVCGEPDREAIADGTHVRGLVGLWDGDRVELGEEWLEVIGLVGHTPGSIALAYAGAGPVHLFTGDSLFPGGPGKTGSTADFNSLLDDLEAKIFARFADDTVVHPGHGDDTTLGAERPHLAEWRGAAGEPSGGPSSPMVASDRDAPRLCERRVAASRGRWAPQIVRARR